MNNRIEVKGAVPGKFLIFLNSASKSCCDFTPFGPMPPELKPLMASAAALLAAVTRSRKRMIVSRPLVLVLYRKIVAADY